MSEADKTTPPISGDYRSDVRNFSQLWQRAPTADVARAARERFLAAHVETLYRALTNDLSSFIRVERLVHDAARAVPGLVPSADELAAENALEQKSKRGLEIDQGIFLAHVLARSDDRRAPLPRDAAAAAGSARAARRIPARRHDRSRHREPSSGAARPSIVTMRNPRFLNAEDEHDPRARPRSRSISRSSIRKSEVARAARRRGRPSEVSPAGASSRPASTSPISITARSPSSGTSCATWAS